jgi:hypothetical protein
MHAVAIVFTKSDAYRISGRLDSRVSGELLVIILLIQRHPLKQISKQRG